MVDWNRVGNALAGFGAGYEGRGTEFLQGLQDREAYTNLARLGRELAAGNIDQAQYLKGMAQYSPKDYGKVALSQLGIDQPADVRSWLYMNNLPANRQQEFKDFRRNPQWINAGDRYVNPNTNTEIPVNPKPEEMPDFKRKQSAATAGGKVEGENITEAQEGLPTFLSSADNQLSLIDQMIGNKEKGMPEHPGLTSALGGIEGASWMPSVRDKTIDFEALLEQSKSGAFLESIQKMQGFGALSNEEGKAATAAATRMRTKISEEGFRKAAKEYRDIITKGIEKMKNKAAIDVGSPSAFEQTNKQLSDSEKVVKQVEQSALEMPTSKSALKANTLYKTPRGVALWDGEKFIQE